MDAVGAVLAGGEGSRLGGSKAAALLAGRPLLSYPLAALRAVVGEVAVVAKAETELPAVGYGVLIWREADEPRHPLAGIVEALRRAEGRPVVVLACDLPFVTAELVRELVSADAGDAPAVVATTHEHGPQPLCARYEPAALDLLAGFDPAGRAITQVQALGPLHLAVDPDLLRNVNSAEDLAAAEAELSRR
jgi:molybdopterin-guanine dinucleotide biosynthesis protein A